MKYIYVAGPLFNTHERWYLERIAEALEAAGYRTFLPQRDAGLVKLGSSEERLRIFKIDMDALNAADLIVALLTGTDHDSGTSAELGYMYALGKPCYGISDDKRGGLNNIIWGICANGERIVRSIDELLLLIQEK
ncbi:MAG: nucleoside 2-deoxyribosyltransferase [Ktedonobacteraceae bacterium]